MKTGSSLNSIVMAFDKSNVYIYLFKTQNSCHLRILQNTLCYSVVITLVSRPVIILVTKPVITLNINPVITLKTSAQ